MPNLSAVLKAKLEISSRKPSDRESDGDDYQFVDSVLALESARHQKVKVSWVWDNLYLMVGNFVSPRVKFSL